MHRPGDSQEAGRAGRRTKSRNEGAQNQETSTRKPAGSCCSPLGLSHDSHSGAPSSPHRCSLSQITHLACGEQAGFQLALKAVCLVLGTNFAARGQMLQSLQNIERILLFVLFMWYQGLNPTLHTELHLSPFLHVFILTQGLTKLPKLGSNL